MVAWVNVNKAKIASRVSQHVISDVLAMRALAKALRSCSRSTIEVLLLDENDPSSHHRDTPRPRIQGQETVFDSRSWSAHYFPQANLSILDTFHRPILLR